MLVCSIIHGVQFFTFLTAGEQRKGISGRERRKRRGALSNVGVPLHSGVHAGPDLTFLA